MEELWKGVPGFDDYEASNTGRVRRLSNGKELHASQGNNGYMLVNLRNDGRTYTKSLHTVIALTWVPNEDPAHNREVNHIDRNKHNNRADNLEWTTHWQNMAHGFSGGAPYANVVKRMVDKGFAPIDDAALAREVAYDLEFFIHDYFEKLSANGAVRRIEYR